MSHFEFISVAASIILAMGVTRLVGGITYVVRGESRYWVHSLWCLQALVNQAMTWWYFWNYRSIEVWTLGAFLLVLLYPVLTYIGASILAPAEATRSTDWRAYFFDVRVALFALMVVQQITTAVTLIAIRDIPVMSPPIYLLSFYATLYCAGLYYDSARVHAGVVVLNALSIVILYAPLVYRPLESFPRT